VDYLLVHEYRQGEATVLATHGELDFRTGAQLAGRLANLAVAGRHRIVLDVAGLAFCDTHGIRIMIGGHVRARDHGGWLRVVRPDWRIRKLLAILPALEIPEAFESITDALADASTPAPTPRPQ
jgi:anti-sigma B factor antagonist